MLIKLIVNYLNLNRDFLFNVNLSSHFKIACLFLILIPFTLITGPFLPDLFLAIIAIYFLVISIMYKLVGYYKNKLVIFFLLFYSCILLRGIFSEFPYESLIDFNGPIFYFRYLFFVLGIQYLITTHPNLIKIFSINLSFILLFTILDGYLQWLTGFNIFGFQSPSTRVTGIFNDEEILGHFLSHIVPLAMGLLVYSYGSKKKLIFLYMAFLVISEILIFITNDRSGFFKIFQFTLLLIFLSNNFKLFRILSFGISICAIALILSTSNNSKERYQGTLEDVTSTAVPYMPWTPHHDKQYLIAISMFNENPLFGKGPQSFRILCMKATEYIDGCTNHPHNYYFQTLGELGILGVIFLFVGFFNITYVLLKQFINIWFTKNNKLRRLPDHLVILYSLIFIFLWPLIPHQTFYNNWLNVLIFLPIGFILFFVKQKNYFSDLNDGTMLK